MQKKSIMLYGPLKMYLPDCQQKNPLISFLFSLLFGAQMFGAIPGYVLRITG